MTNVRRRFFASQGGYSIIAVIVEATVLLVSFLGLYIGILYAEAQLVQNYHTRVATLLAAGEVDWQMYYLNTFSMVSDFTSKDVTIEEYPDGRVLQGVMTMSYSTEVDMSTGDPVEFVALEVKVRWVNPVDNKPRSVVIREDFFK